MHDSAHRLLRMVNGLLDVARIEVDGLRATPQPTDLAELTRDLLQPFRSAAGRAQVSSRPGSTPPSASCRWTRSCGRRSC